MPRNYNTIGSVRLSQIITQSGPGSIIDLRAISVLPLSLDSWVNNLDPNGTGIDDRLLIKDQSMIEALKSQFPRLVGFIQLLPEQRFNNQTQQMERVNKFYYVRIFPEWGFCPNCRRLDKFDNLRVRVDENNNRLGYYDLPYKCKHCTDYDQPENTHPTLVPARLVVACSNGHLDDFPWILFTHHPYKDCTVPDKRKHRDSHLKIKSLGKSSQLGDLQVRCVACGSSNTLDLAFDYNSPIKNLQCSGRRPERQDWDSCKREVTNTPLLRGATNLHFSELTSGLSIPFDNDSANGDVASGVQSIIDEYNINMDDPEDPDQIMQTVNFLLGQQGYPQLVSFKELLAKYHQKQSTTSLVADIRLKEYIALRDKSNINTDNFVSEEFSIPSDSKASEFFDKIVLVRKLREIVVMTGFSRISPSGDIYAKLTGDESPNLAKSVHLSSKAINTTYLPGVEYWGEGIFFALNPELLDMWKTKPMEQRAANLATETDQSVPDPLFVLAHSFSHALLIALAEEAGYSITSLKERLYAALSYKSKKIIPGFLIYTATPDSEGSLGGLIRIIESDKLESILDRMQQLMFWCSSDPICIETTFSRSMFRNHAACHACIFLPETSCEARNEFLDRAMLVGTTEDRSIGFLNKVYDNGGDR